MRLFLATALLLLLGAGAAHAQTATPRGVAVGVSILPRLAATVLAVEPVTRPAPRAARGAEEPDGSPARIVLPVRRGWGWAVAADLRGARAVLRVREADESVRGTGPLSLAGHSQVEGRLVVEVGVASHGAPASGVSGTLTYLIAPI